MDSRFKTRIGNDLQILKSQSKNCASKVSIKFPHVRHFRNSPDKFPRKLNAEKMFGAQICIAIVTPFCNIYIPTTNNRFRLRQSNTLYAEFEAKVPHTRSKWSPHNAANNSAKISLLLFQIVFVNGQCPSNFTVCGRRKSRERSLLYQCRCLMAQFLNFNIQQ